MKIIGEKLTNQEMLNTKGGLCALCYCHDLTGVWYADYDSFQDSDNDIQSFCDGNGTCDYAVNICHTIQ